MLVSRQPGWPGTEMTVHWKVAYEGKSVRPVYGRSGDTLSNKVQPNLLFDYKRETFDAKRAAPPDPRQRVASLRPASMRSTAVRPLV
ncbi:hypothetical protein CUJ89_33010 [Burkholderia pyrrocinia]|uniref:Uncharacterized protein n=1 Tax=Burkholderia pyrrocinia TaxID=60550 RepID=A0A2Z5N638_BURPY|nr:hypothetical protein CUJ89_33010 [Burkholderia pyrrocinia]